MWMDGVLTFLFAAIPSFSHLLFTVQATLIQLQLYWPSWLVHLWCLVKEINNETCSRLCNCWIIPHSCLYIHVALYVISTFLMPCKRNQKWNLIKCLQLSNDTTRLFVYIHVAITSTEVDCFVFFGFCDYLSWLNCISFFINHMFFCSVIMSLVFTYFAVRVYITKFFLSREVIER